MGVFKKRIAGMEINDCCIRVVELSGSNNNDPVITCYGKKLLENGIVKDGKVANKDGFKKALGELKKEIKLKSTELILGLNNDDVLIRFLKLPKIEKSKLGSFIRFQSADYIPFKIEDFEIDYTILGEQKTSEGEFYNVLLVAARKTMLNDYLNVFESTRFLLRDIKSSVLSVDIFLPKEYENKTCAIINFSCASCSILILGKKVPVFARSIIVGTNEKENIAEFVLAEIGSSILYAHSQNRSLLVEKILLIGSDAAKTGIKQDIENSLHISTEVLKPYRNLYEAKTTDITQAELDAAKYAVALSLALHGFEGVK